MDSLSAGRRPLALYDLIAAVPIAGISSGFVDPQSGISVWIIGSEASTFGISACVALELATMKLVKARGEGVLGYCYAGSFAAVIVATVTGGIIGGWFARL